MVPPRRAARESENRAAINQGTFVAEFIYGNIKTFSETDKAYIYDAERRSNSVPRIGSEATWIDLRPVTLQHCSTGL